MAKRGGICKRIKRWLSDRTSLEKVLFVFLFVTLLCLAGLAITLAVKDMQVEDGLCVTPECVKSANEVLMWIDPEVDPCEDFYNYTCNRWVDDAEGTSTRFPDLNLPLELRLKELLEDEEDEVPEHFQKARSYYEICMDTEKRESSGCLNRFLADLQSFGGYPVLNPFHWDAANFNLLSTLRHMHGKGSMPGTLVTVNAGLDLKNNSRHLITVSQATIGLPGREYFGREDVVENYVHMLARQAHQLCQHNEDVCPSRFLVDIKDELRHAVKVERDIANLIVTSEDSSSTNNIYNIMKISDLQDRAPGISWLGLIRIYFPEVAEWEEIMVHTPVSMEALASYVSSMVDPRNDNGRRDLANYLMYRHTTEASLHLTRDLAQIHDEFYSAVLDREDPPDQSTRCLHFTTQTFDLSLASVYAQEYFPPENKAALEDIVSNIRTDLKEILERTQWMDKDTQNAALLKLEKMHTLAGYPEDILDSQKVDLWYKKLVIVDNHYENYKWTSIFLHTQPWDTYKEPVDKTSWSYLPGGLLQTNVFFNNHNNTIFIPLGIVQDWFFAKDSPKYMNYARMGFVVARELAHAVDAIGAEFDEEGNWRMWWTNDTQKHFEQSSKCTIDMANSYTGPETSKKINGALAFLESMADDMGTVGAYKAYSTASSQETDQSLPGVDQSHQRLFWINLASMWCEKHPNEVLLLESGHQTPSRLRIHSMLSNSEDFIRDFECEVELKECHIWR